VIQSLVEPIESSLIQCVKATTKNSHDQRLLGTEMIINSRQISAS